MADQDDFLGDEQEESDQTINFKPSFVMVAIDTHPSMFIVRENEDGTKTHPFKDALRACYELADSLILKKSRNHYNQFGVVLANEDDKASFIEVENNLLDSIKLLKAKAFYSNEELKKNYERQSDLDLASFFLLCKKKFKDINSAFYKRTLIFITNDENPVKNDPQKRFTALNEGKMLEAGDIYFKLITMKDNFDYTAFYNELFSLQVQPPSIDDFCQDMDGLLGQLRASIVSPYTKIRCNFFPFKNDHTRYLKVMKANYIRQAKLMNTNRATRDGKLLKRMRENMGVDFKGPVYEYTLDSSNTVELSFGLSDKYDIYANELPLGFHLQYVSNPQSKPEVVINRPSIMIQDPKEELDYFDHFWQYCIDKNKVLVCIKKYRHPTDIRYVELIPKFATNQKLFLIKDMPFCNEKTVPKSFLCKEYPTFETSADKNEVARHFIDDLTFDYDPKLFINPSYGKKKAFVKSKLLGEPIEEVEDVTINVEEMDKKLENLVEDIKNVFNISDVVPKKGAKRKAPSTSERGRGKKAAK